jgi:polyphenol oxidase
MQFTRWNQLGYYSFDNWSVRHGIFTRHGGVSPAPWASLNMGGNVGDSAEAVRENHQRMYDALSLNASRVCTVWQVHSADVIIATEPNPEQRWLAHADALVTDRADTPLSMRFADCTPILLHDPIQGVIGIAHAGWRGTVQGVARAAAASMIDTFGCKSHNIRAGIGPSISQPNYQVGEEVVSAIRDHFGFTDGMIIHADDGSAYLDLWEANRLDLRAAGVEQVEIMGLCTADHVEDFFSHRREHGKTGRFGAVISL